ncbi:hypothetical protein [Microbacterium capsulatum]|uniref:Uncharacterized protein n=1 Tax=Microbacterium capsulatum TaxID=3041921 RepID=A0ABU0XFU6_9MICO|nr:hypothetical protein [Microbacterium sp. ASV81]MDQ4212570.1 hypothetical protein [Microbacterium sp. ASV81]
MTRTPWIVAHPDQVILKTRDAVRTVARALVGRIRAAAQREGQ